MVEKIVEITQVECDGIYASQDISGGHFCPIVPFNSDVTCKYLMRGKDETHSFMNRKTGDPTFYYGCGKRKCEYAD